MLDFPSAALPKGAISHRRTLSSFAPADSRSSSLQKVWAEDYFTNDDSGHFQQDTFADIIAPPAPATLTERHFHKSIPLSYDEEQAIPREPRTHQHSLTALLPFRTSRTNSASPQRSPQRSPVKEKADFEFEPTLTGDTDHQIRIADRSKGGLSGWFTGTSAPVVVGLPINDQEESLRVTLPTSTSAPSSPERAPVKLQKKPAMPSLDISQPAPAKAATGSMSRFSFFSPKTPSSTQHQIPAELSDELLTLDIRSVLFPNGDHDPFSPSAFKNLLMNAEGMLSKLQTAYKIRTLSLRELTAEKEAQADELEEAETRAMHLKMQLEDMAQRVMAHDEEMKNVVGELVKEKQARAEEREAREKSINLIKFHPMSPAEEVSLHSEDLEVDSRHRRGPWRRSGGTIASETSCESDDDSGSAASVFSRSMSPSVSSISSGHTPEMRQATFTKVISVGPANALSPKKFAAADRPRPVQRQSTFQKILRGIASTPEEGEAEAEAEEDDELGVAVEGCRNCRGGTSSVAWDTVGLLRMENRGLKERVAGLETAVEGALDLVNGLRL